MTRTANRELGRRRPSGQTDENQPTSQRTPQTLDALAEQPQFQVASVGIKLPASRGEAFEAVKLHPARTGE
ncbi:MAG: hypothetical protein ACR2KP_05025 [Egibacteraceae bacterium]